MRSTYKGCVQLKEFYKNDDVASKQLLGTLIVRNMNDEINPLTALFLNNSI